MKQCRAKGSVLTVFLYFSPSQAPGLGHPIKSLLQVSKEFTCRLCELLCPCVLESCDQQSTSTFSACFTAPNLLSHFSLRDTNPITHYGLLREWRSLFIWQLPAERGSRPCLQKSVCSPPTSACNGSLIALQRTKSVRTQ